MDKLDVSVVILTRNEEENIEACLTSCSFAREIIVVDDGSEDRTVEIAERFEAEKVKVLHRSLNGDFGAQKSFGINNATYPWVLIVDADELVTPEMVGQITDCIAQETLCCYSVQRENHFHSGKATHGAMKPDWVVRLFPKKDSKFVGCVHEKFQSPYQIKKLKGRGLIHYPYRDWESYYRKFDKYTSLSAEKFLKSGKRCSFMKDIVARPLWGFIKVYFFDLGFLDGRLGWIFAVNHYFYTMTKYVKLYTLEKTLGRL